MYRTPVRTLVVAILLFFFGVGLSPAADAEDHQTRNTHFGVSGGNVNNISSAFCCSGTLGSLVDIDGTKYILSNNHVLADADTATTGEEVSQPGLIDNSCQPATVVATYTAAPVLGTSNVDAAIAQDLGIMNSSGYIADIGVPDSTITTATLNLSVAKSGRTTAFTCGSVTSIDTTVTVQYQKGCNQGKKFTVTYTNQVVVGGSGFSAGGDSGSLIVTQASASPVALLFAGSSTTTIGNPVADVTDAFRAMGIGEMSFVGTVGGTTDLTTKCATTGGKPSNSHGHGPKAGQIAYAASVKERHAARLMANPAVMGVGIGADANNPDLANIVIYVEEGRSHAPLPAELDGVPTQIIRTDRIRAYGWNETQSDTPQSCAAK